MAVEDGASNSYAPRARRERPRPRKTRRSAGARFCRPSAVVRPARSSWPTARPRKSRAPAAARPFSGPPRASFRPTLVTGPRLRCAAPASWCKFRRLAKPPESSFDIRTRSLAAGRARCRRSPSLPSGQPSNGADPPSHLSPWPRIPVDRSPSPGPRARGLRPDRGVAPPTAGCTVYARAEIPWRFHLQRGHCHREQVDHRDHSDRPPGSSRAKPDAERKDAERWSHGQGRCRSHFASAGLQRSPAFRRNGALGLLKIASTMCKYQWRV